VFLIVRLGGTIRKKDKTRATPRQHLADGHPEGGQQNPKEKNRDSLRRKTGPPRLFQRLREATILLPVSCA
jgi:hypothetical protein